MSSPRERAESRLTIDLEPELQRQIEAAAAERGVTVRDYVVAALRHAMHSQDSPGPGDDPAWTRLSDRAFARDWESDADRVYDDLA